MNFKMKATLAGAAAALAMASVPGAAMARDTISIVGSSTVYPFATVVAERLPEKIRSLVYLDAHVPDFIG